MESQIRIKLWFKENEIDSLLDQELRHIRQKERAERIRSLATIAIIVRPISNMLNSFESVGNSNPNDTLGYKDERETFDDGTYSVQVALSSYSHPELYSELINTPSGYVTARLRALSEAGLIIQKLTSAVDSLKRPSTSNVFEEQHNQTAYSEIKVAKKASNAKPLATLHQQASDLAEDAQNPEDVKSKNDLLGNSNVSSVEKHSRSDGQNSPAQERKPETATQEHKPEHRRTEINSDADKEQSGGGATKEKKKSSRVNRINMG